jgi:V-type H+-transporting ATPase subunit C
MVIKAELKKKRLQRMPFCIVPDAPFPLGIEDKEKNTVHRIIIYKPQQDDVIKALRKRGYTPRVFTYNKTAWEEENKERSVLSEQVSNATTQLNKVAVSAFQQLFTALMHLKVVRAYIDGVLRFGIPPKFFIGVVMPRRGAERSVLTDMMNVLCDEKLKDMYGEKQDAQEAEDYWPYVCVHLTSPNFMHAQKE